MIVRDYDSKNVLKDLIRVLERASSETCAFIEIRLELREIYELLTELHKIPNANEAERQAEREDAPSIDIVRRKPVVGYEGYYEVDMYGNVYSVARKVQVNDNGRIYDKPVKEKKLTASKHSCGYRTVALTRNGKTEQQYIHRIVAEAYIPNPQNLPWINHKDEDKANNFVGNLEWCTPLYNNTYNEKNIKHSEKIKGRSFTDEHKERIRQSNLGKHGQQRKVICVDDGTVFGSYNEAGKHYGISPMTVKSCCERKSKGKVRTFRYADDFCSYGEREGE